MTTGALVFLILVVTFSAQLISSTAQQWAFVKVNRQAASVKALFIGMNYYYLTVCSVGPVTLATLRNDYLSQEESFQSKYLTDWEYQIVKNDDSVVATISAKVLEQDFADRLVNKVVPGASANIVGDRITWEKAMMGQTQTSVLMNIERQAFGTVTSC